MGSFGLSSQYGAYAISDLASGEIEVVSGGSGAWFPWQCVMGTVGGILGGGLMGAAAGAAVAGFGAPPGALIGAISGGLTGAAASCFNG